MSWRQLILDHQSTFLKWIEATDARMVSLNRVSNCLESYLTSRLQSPKDCIQFWNAIPLVRAACNFNETYELPFAVEAYAYVHILDRYWRTWDALIELTTNGVLPLGSEGVRILDVGAGPLPTTYAIWDFFEQLRKFGDMNSIPELVKQGTHFDIVERSDSMRQFMHRFSEHCQFSGPYGAEIIDFSDVNPRSERKALEQFLRKKEHYDASADDFYYEYSPEEASFSANRHRRYRMVVFSNFFTMGHIVDQFEQVLMSLFSDLSSGAVVLIIGATSNQYEEVYSRLTLLAQNNGLRKLTEIKASLGETSQISKAQVEIKRCQHTVFQHLRRVTNEPNLPKVLDSSVFHYLEFAKQLGLELGPNIRWPDYWNPKPFPNKRVEFVSVQSV